MGSIWLALHFPIFFSLKNQPMGKDAKDINGIHHKHQPLHDKIPTLKIARCRNPWWFRASPIFEGCFKWWQGKPRSTDCSPFPLPFRNHGFCPHQLLRVSDVGFRLLDWTVRWWWWCWCINVAILLISTIDSNMMKYIDTSILPIRHTCKSIKM